MRSLLLLPALWLPATATATAQYTLEEVGAMAPDQRSFTNSPLLPLTGISQGPSEIEPVPDGARGGGYDVQDVGNISLVAGPWNYNSLSGDHIYGTLNEFLTTHEDDYDFVSIFVTESLNFGAFYSPLQNDTIGIGSQVFDQTSQWGFGDLEGFLFMNSVFDYLGSARDALFFGQEVGHRWGAYVRRSGGGRDMLGRDDAHWNFYLESQNSTMEGNAWVEVEDGIFETDHMAEIGYSELDMYLMGFMDPEEVEDWFLIQNPQILRNQIGWDTGGSSAPYYAIRAYYPEEDVEDLPAIRVAGNRLDISLEDVVAVHGEREPDFEESQREFNMAFVIMMPQSEAITFDEYLVVEDIAEELTTLWENMVRGEAVLNHNLGATDRYEFSPAAFPEEVTWEPSFDDSTDTGLTGSGCTASLAGGSSPALWAFVLGVLAFVRRRS